MKDRAISLNAVKNILKMANMEEFDIVAYRNIMQLPPVTSSRPTGHWIHRKMDNECWEECSECYVEREYPTLYCPDCGVKMEVEQNG